MIAESTIDRTLDRLENAGDDYEVQIQDFADDQPELMDYLTNEDAEAFTETERELLLFAALVVYQSIDDERSGLRTATGDQIATAEERNYAVLSAARGGSLRDRLTPFFEQSGEEELLAFIEDLTLSEDEESSISNEAREPFFVTLKTVMDVLI